MAGFEVVVGGGCFRERIGLGKSGRNPSAVTACPFRGGAWIRYELILQTAVSKPHLGILWPGCHSLIIRSVAVCLFGRAAARHEGLMDVCRLQSHRRCITGLAIVSFLSRAKSGGKPAFLT